MAAPRKPAGSAAEMKPQYSLAAFAAEATRDPWIMDTGNGSPVVIAQPDEETMKAVATALDSPQVTRWDLLKIVAGDAVFARLDKLIDKAPAGTAERVWESVEAHFGWGNSEASPGS